MTESLADIVEIIFPNGGSYFISREEFDDAMNVALPIQSFLKSAFKDFISRDASATQNPESDDRETDTPTDSDAVSWLQIGRAHV